MEVFGFDFDDSVFAETRDRVAVTLSSYKAKYCEPEWFCEEVSTDDELEKQKVFKFRADLAYRRHDYEKALREYLNCFSLVPDSNIAIRRDVLESLSRCYCRLGRPEKALEIAEQLRKDATNTGHLSAVLNLQLTLHCSSGELRKQISTLQDLISLMPCNPCHWKKLGMAYLNIFKSLPSSGPARTATVSPARPDGCNGVADPSQRRSSDCLEGVSIAGPYTRHGEEENPISDSHRGEPEVKTTTEEQGNEEAQDVWLRACVCFVRSSLLFRMVKFQQSSFVSQSNRRAREEIEGALRTLDLKEEVLRVITEVMGEDLVSEKLKEESQETENCSSLASVQVPCETDFEERWFNRLKRMVFKSGNQELLSYSDTKKNEG